jgi:hypothetical protein
MVASSGSGLTRADALATSFAAFDEPLEGRFLASGPEPPLLTRRGDFLYFSYAEQSYYRLKKKNSNSKHDKIQLR